jgi:lipid A ethanolaminephosphotransferase
MTKIFTAQNRTIVLVSLFIMLTGNYSFFRHFLEIYPPSLDNMLFILSVSVFFTMANVAFFLLICHGESAKWLMALYLITASLAAYYMDQYSVIIDTVMIDNIAQTDTQEFLGLLNANLFIRLFIFGVLPAWIILKYAPVVHDVRSELKYKLTILLLCIMTMLVVSVPFSAGYASFIREHKITRAYLNPTYFSYSLLKYIKEHITTEQLTSLTPVAMDAFETEPKHKNELIILVVGETARADRFSLNGYAKETNPALKKQNVVSFSNVSSCGTSTGESVPCMFSILNRKDFSRDKALHMENALDVLQRNGVEILWRDNNSDSKGVATRMRYENFKSPTMNTACDSECRDIGMLGGLDAYIKSKSDKDILIVLHQMGNHGPEYYRRYPKAFERFKPICKSNELRNCSQQEIDNAYDNAILYTDYFLSKVIDFLKQYDGEYETAMVYTSDHGESLGEHGMYLHAAPYMIAPKEQTHIPAIVWMGKHFDFSIDQIKPLKDYPLSHDHLFCALLMGFEVATKTCELTNKVLQDNAALKFAAVASSLPESKGLRD